ncbi:hypothetical protein [Sorangium sp. So ce363]|uniref:hypothetical protein n=1 Tax=Sorangium sp. So ce363 TaxID=3133304 RepID=UPI003F5E6CE7
MRSSARTDRLGLALALALVVAGCGGPRASPDAPQAAPGLPAITARADHLRAKRDEERRLMAKPNVRPEDMVFWGRWFIEAAQETAYLDVQTDEELRAVQAASGLWPSAIFLPAASPYAPGAAVRHRFHLGEHRDILHHRYMASGLDLDVHETSAIIVTWVNTDLGPEPRRPEVIRRIAAALFTMGLAPLHFFPGVGDESLRFSTDPFNYFSAPPPGEPKLDGGVARDALYFMHHKIMMGRLVGYPPEQGWLGEPLRRAWAARRVGP